MNKFLLLYRTLRKCDGPASAGEEADRPKNTVLILAAGVVLALLVVGGMGYVGYTCSGLFEMMGGVSVVFAVLGLVLGVILTVKSLVQLINLLYMSTSTALLITLPLSPVTLATVRLTNVLLRTFLSTAGVLASFAVGYGVAVGAGASFWIGLCLYVVLLPLFVTLAAAVLAMALMSVFRAFRSRNTLRHLGVAAALVVGLAYVLWSGMSSSGAEVGQFVRSAVDLTKNYLYIIPIIPFLCRFMQTGEAAPVLWAALSTAAVLVLYLAAAKGLYLRGAVNMQDAAASSRRLEGQALERAYTARGRLASYRRKEMRLLRRDPVFLLKNFIIAFGWPVVFGVMCLVAYLRQDPAAQEAAAQEAAASESVEAAMGPDAGVVLCLTLAAVCMVVLLVNSLSDLAYSAVTREGASFFVMKQLPIPMRDQIRAKRDVALRMVGVTTVGYLAAGALAGAAFGVIPWYAVAYGLAAGIPLLYLAVDVDMLYGIRHANLHWDNEAAAIRKNAKLALGGYLLAVALAVGLLLLSTVLTARRFPAVPCLLAVPVLLAAAAVLADRRMFRAAETELEKL